MIYKKQHYRILMLSLFIFWISFGSINPARAQKESERPPVSYTVQVPDTVMAGEQFLVSIVFDIAESWYIYAPTGNNTAQGMVETKINFELPEGITTVRKIKWPKPYSKGSYEVYEGKDITISQAFVTKPRLKSGSYGIKAKVRYQTCNENMCLPPIKEKFTIKVHIK